MSRLGHLASMAPHLTCQVVHVATGSADSEGFLVLADDTLVAVVVRLEDEAAR